MVAQDLDKEKNIAGKRILPEVLWALLLPVLVGCACIGLWWAERLWRFGWDRPIWFDQSWWSIYPMIALVAGIFLYPLKRAWNIPKAWMGFYMLLLSVGSWGAYQETRAIFYTLYTQGLLTGESGVITASIWKLFGVVLLVAGVYFVPLWQFHHSTDRLHILTLVEAFVLVIPCSLISLEMLSLGQANGAFIDAVRWGYPFFWVPVFLGWVAVGTAREWI